MEQPNKVSTQDVRKMFVFHAYGANAQVETSDADTACIEIIDGPFEGVIYHYLSAGIVEDPDKQGATVRMSYDIDVLPPEFDVELLEDDTWRQQFETLIGNILVTVVLESDEHREDNS